MAESETGAFVDGIMSIGTHNNVHRIVCYRLTAADKPKRAVELMIPASSLDGFIAALKQISEDARPQAPVSLSEAEIVVAFEKRAT